MHVLFSHTQIVVAELHASRVSIALANSAPYKLILCPLLAHFFLECSIYAFSRYMSPSLAWTSYPFPPKPEKNEMVVSLAMKQCLFPVLQTEAAHAILRQENLDLGFKVVNSCFGRTGKRPLTCRRLSSTARGKKRERERNKS